MGPTERMVMPWTPLDIWTASPQICSRRLVSYKSDCSKQFPNQSRQMCTVDGTSCDLEETRFSTGTTPTDDEVRASSTFCVEYAAFEASTSTVRLNAASESSWGMWPMIDNDQYSDEGRNQCTTTARLVFSHRGRWACLELTEGSVMHVVDTGLSCRLCIQTIGWTFPQMRNKEPF